MPEQQEKQDKKPIAAEQSTSSCNGCNRLSQQQETRYARQIALPEIGREGQVVLGSKRVLIVGAGGLGTPCAAYLAGAGVGHIAIVDNDVVSLSNLQRQILYNMDDIGKQKAMVLTKKLAAANDALEIVAVTQTMTMANASNLISGYDIVISCVDNPGTRYILNQACINNGIPMVEGAISGFTGIVATIIPGQGPCYQCIFPNKPVPGHKPVGVASPTPGVVGSIQAAEAIKLLLGKGVPLTGRLLLIDLLKGDFRTVSVSNSPDCPVCGKAVEAQTQTRP